MAFHTVHMKTGIGMWTISIVNLYVNVPAGDKVQNALPCLAAVSVCYDNVFVCMYEHICTINFLFTMLST